jgi:hypothetical protein
MQSNDIYYSLACSGGLEAALPDWRGALIGGVNPFMRRYSTIWP